MSIQVTRPEPNHYLPFLVEFGHVQQRFTKKAAMEFKKKLELALDELTEHEAMKLDIGE